MKEDYIDPIAMYSNEAIISKPSGNLVYFWQQDDIDEIASRETGKTVFKKVVYIKIQTPGDRLNIIEREATEQDKKTYSGQYEAFLKKEEYRAQGFQLRSWREIDKVRLMGLEAEGVYTLEQFAEYPDSACNNLGPGYIGLKYKAIAFLKNSSSEVAILQQQIDELKKQLSGNGEVAKTKGKRGRPKKKLIEDVNVAA